MYEAVLTFIAVLDCHFSWTEQYAADSMLTVQAYYKIDTERLVFTLLGQ